MLEILEAALLRLLSACSIVLLCVYFFFCLHDLFAQFVISETLELILYYCQNAVPLAHFLIEQILI